MAADDGVQATVCTPHIDFKYANNRSTIEAAYGQVASAVEAEGIPLRLVRGAEVHMAPDILAKLKDGDLVTYADMGRYLLLEFPFQPVISGVEEMVYRLRLAGVTPVVAHPERIAYFVEDQDRLQQLVRLGALGQVTGGSLLGQFGERFQRAAVEMVRRNLVHVVASDAHDHSYRRPVLSEAAAEVARLFGPERARSMCQEYPAAIVAGEPIDPPEPLAGPRGLKGLFGGLFGRRGGSGAVW